VQFEATVLLFLLFFLVSYGFSPDAGFLPGRRMLRFVTQTVRIASDKTEVRGREGEKRSLG